MSNLTVKGVLPIGVEVEGKRYRDFSIRPGTLRDSVNALEHVESGASPHMMRYATLAQRVSFDGLDAPVTIEMLLDLLDRDAVALENAADEVEKKLDGLSSS